MAWSYGDQSQVSIKWALAAGYVVGFRGERLVTAIALMTAESTRYPGAWHENEDDLGTVLSTDRGAMQINDVWHPDLEGDNETRTGPAYEFLPNLRYACNLSNRGEHFAAWAAYTSGAYLKYREEVETVHAYGTWRLRIPLVPRKFGS